MDKLGKPSNSNSNPNSNHDESPRVTAIPRHRSSRHGKYLEDVEFPTADDFKLLRRVEGGSPRNNRDHANGVYNAPVSRATDGAPPVPSHSTPNDAVTERVDHDLSHSLESRLKFYEEKGSLRQHQHEADISVPRTVHHSPHPLPKIPQPESSHPDIREVDLDIAAIQRQLRHNEKIRLARESHQEEQVRLYRRRLDAEAEARRLAVKLEAEVPAERGEELDAVKRAELVNRESDDLLRRQALDSELRQRIADREAERPVPPLHRVPVVPLSRQLPPSPPPHRVPVVPLGQQLSPSDRRKVTVVPRTHIAPPLDNRQVHGHPVPPPQVYYTQQRADVYEPPARYGGMGVYAEPESYGPSHYTDFSKTVVSRCSGRGRFCQRDPPVHNPAIAIASAGHFQQIGGQTCTKAQWRMFM
jgi:hypothetical protein